MGLRTLLYGSRTLTVLKLAAMYDCEPEYSINPFVCIQCNKKCMSVVTVRLLNKLLKLKQDFVKVLKLRPLLNKD